MSIPTNLTTIDIDDLEIPDTAESAELTCTVCGTPLEYGGRGRKPTKCEEHKRSSSSASARGVSGGGKGSVSQAVDSIDQAYSLMAMGLTLLQYHNAASLLAESQRELREKNAQFLSKDPDLVKAINKAGAAGGRAGFFAAQVMVLAPVAMIGVAEFKEKKEARDAARVE